MTKNNALIIGANGQDGWFLRQHLAATDHEVWGLSRQELRDPDGKSHDPIDIRDTAQISNWIKEHTPAQIYYLAAVHHSSSNADILADDLQARSTAIHVDAPRGILEAIQIHSPHTRFFYAASSHLFAGKTNADPIDEQTPFAPIGIYAQSKLAGVELCRHFREQHGLYTACGFLFNHESWRRSPDFLSKKIVRAVANIVRGQQKSLTLHDLSAQVDWSFAGDIVRAMAAILHAPEPMDFVVASGKLHSAEEFVRTAFELVQLDWRDYVTEEPSGQQKSDIRYPLLGNPTKIQQITHWQPKVDFAHMIQLMIEMELVADTKA